MANVAEFLGAWVRRQPSPKGKVYVGDAAFKLRRERPTLVGIDVAYVSAELREKTPRKRKLIEGAPILAVEILSPSDVHADVSEKVKEYLDAGVALVWVVDPDFETVGVFRADQEPEYFNRQQVLTCEPHLPGFSVRVAELFD